MKRLALMTTVILLLAVPAASGYLGEGPPKRVPAVSKTRAKAAASAKLRREAEDRTHRLFGCTRETRTAFRCRGRIGADRYVLRAHRVWELRIIEPNSWGVEVWLVPA